MMDFIRDIILKYFYLGNFKYAPGSLTSIIIVSIWYFIPNDFNLQFAIIIIHLFLGLYFCYIYSIENNNDEDPSYIVIDEVVGMMFALFLLPKLIFYYFLAFILFRFFDIIKPSFIFRSQNIKYGIGIMMDDILSGLLTLLIIYGYLL